MLTILIHTLIGAIGASCIFALFFHLSGAETTSVPLGLIFVALGCGILSHYLSPWATAIVLAVYALGCGIEWWQDRHPPF